MWYTIPLAAVVRVTLGTGGENEGILGYLWERDDGEVGCCRACVGELPHHQLRGDVSAGQGQETRRLLLKEALNIQVTPAEEHFNQVPRLLMWRQVGRVFSHFLCFRTDYTCSFQLKCWQKGFFDLELFSENCLFCLCRSQLRSKQFKIMMLHKVWLYFCSSSISPNTCHSIAVKYKTKTHYKLKWDVGKTTDPGICSSTKSMLNDKDSSPLLRAHRP